MKILGDYLVFFGVKKGVENRTILLFEIVSKSGGSLLVFIIQVYLTVLKTRF